MRSIRVAAEPDSNALLRVRELGVRFPAGAAVSEVSFDLGRHECLGIVGESGSGKSQLLLSLLGLTPRAAEIRGSVQLQGLELVGAAAARLSAVRGRRIALVFQDSLSALNPYRSVGAQLIEGARRHLSLSRTAAVLRARNLLESLHIDAAPERLRQYPHELSGGLRQRVMIAMALMCEPEILLLDEPTTALDATVQAQLLELLRELRARTGIASILVSHDLAALATVADRVAVMYAGRMVELAPVAQLYAAPRHPYTAGLLRSMPRLDAPLTARLPSIPGQPPVLGSISGGCAFAPRCVLVHERCRAVPQPRWVAAQTAWVACHDQRASHLIQEAWT